MNYLHKALHKLGRSIIISALFISCTTSGPSGIFGKKTPHDEYGQRLTDAGLKETALGRQWFQAAEQSLGNPLTVTLPYSETGYFASDRPSAAGIRFAARRGQKLRISLSKKPITGFAIYLDLWQPSQTGDNKPKLLASADTTNATLQFEVREDGNYQLRVQPELLKSGEYTLSISTGPSLAFPVSSGSKSNIASFWGAGRDAGARKHEGIDIFAPRRTPLVAAAEGVVTAVNENTLGGKVVWLRPSGKDYTLYYAHLDEQIAQPGQAVQVGDTVGLVGNTGNARTTSPHLHFGIYTREGAINPLPFVDPTVKTPEKITAPTNTLDRYARTSKATKLYNESNPSSSVTTSLEPGAIVFVEAATSNWYKVGLPDGSKGFVQANNVTAANDAIKKYKLPASTTLLDAPADAAARKAELPLGETVSILGSFANFYYVKNAKNQDGWIAKKLL